MAVRQSHERIAALPWWVPGNLSPCLLPVSIDMPHLGDWWRENPLPSNVSWSGNQVQVVTTGFPKAGQQWRVNYSKAEEWSEAVPLIRHYSETSEALNALFVLRSCFLHGLKIDHKHEVFLLDWKHWCTFHRILIGGWVSCAINFLRSPERICCICVTKWYFESQWL